MTHYVVYLHRNDTAYLEMASEPVFSDEDAYRRLFWWHPSVHDAELYADFRKLVTQECRRAR